MKPRSLRIGRDIYQKARKAMVDAQIVGRGVRRKEVIDAMLAVPRHLFVEEGLQQQAYSDYPLPIGEKQTISQPYMVALMTEALCPKAVGGKVLEIGTGSGYQTAVLSLIADKVYSIERISPIAARARRVLDSLMCSNVVIRVGDGTLGWPDEAPFDAILVTAAAPSVPQSYLDQLSADGGTLVIPVGEEFTQDLVRITKTPRGVEREFLGGCRFVKLIGRQGWGEEGQ